MSQLITLANLNTVYKDIRDRIDALGDVYSPMGSKTCGELLKLINGEPINGVIEDLQVGWVYNIIVDDNNPVINLPGVEAKDIADGDNVVCILKDGSKAWAKLGGVYELATNDKAGLIFLGEDIVTEDNGGVQFGLNMGNKGTPEKVDGSSHWTYVDIPFATGGQYGLISSNTQDISGTKTFLDNAISKNQFIVGSSEDGGLRTVINPDSIIVGENGSSGASTLTINGNARGAESSLGAITTDFTKVQNLKFEDSTGTSYTLTVTGDASSTGGSLGNLTVTGDSAVKDLSMGDQKLTISGDASASSLNVGTIETSSSVDPKINTLSINNGIISKNLEITGTATATSATITNLGTDENPINTLYTNSLTVDNTGSITANTVKVDKITGSDVGSSLTVQTININNGEGVSLDYATEVTKQGNKINDKPVYDYKDGLFCNKSFGVLGHLYAYKVHNAVWNDLADAIEIDCKPEYGYVYCFDGERYSKSSKYCQKGVIGIHSDTAGMIMGEKGSENELNCAVAGFVLAHVDKVYPSGTPLTADKDGVLTKMKKKDLILHPDRLVANFWKVEVSEKWNGVEVNNRCWVKVR